MTEQQFAYWLQGFAELTGDTPTAEQWKSIREHLATVFVKVTPPVGQKPDLAFKVAFPNLSQEKIIQDYLDATATRQSTSLPSSVCLRSGAIC